MLIDATSGRLTGKRGLPWYLVVMLLAQPLHFGDYGGLPLKLLWAAFDLIAIVLLGSGLYLWFAKWRSPSRALASSEIEGVAELDDSAEPVTV